MSLFKRLFRRSTKPELVDVSPEFQEANDRMVQDQGPENYRHLFEVLLRTTFWVPNDEGSEPGLASVSLLQYPNGHLVLPAFTEAPLLMRWSEKETDMLVLTGQAFFQVAAQTPADLIHINPEGPVGGMVTAEQVRFLAEGVVPIEDDLPAPEDVASMRIGPAERPLSAEGRESVRQALTDHGRVRAAYHGSLALNEQIRLTLGIVFDDTVDPEEAREEIDALRATIHSMLSPRDLPLYVIPLGEPPVEEAFREAAERVFGS